MRFRKRHALYVVSTPQGFSVVRKDWKLVKQFPWERLQRMARNGHRVKKVLK